MDELLLYLINFWRFVFSRQFRIDYIASFHRMKKGRKFLEIVGALTSTFVGLATPAFLVMWLAGAGDVKARIDSCLDNSGSFNYKSCTCDYKNSHPYQEVHQCR